MKNLSKGSHGRDVQAHEGRIEGTDRNSINSLITPVVLPESWEFEVNDSPSVTSKKFSTVIAINRDFISKAVVMEFNELLMSEEDISKNESGL